MAGIAHALMAFLTHYGAPALFLCMTLETLGLPLPGETALIVTTSAAAAPGGPSLWAVALAGWSGAVLGDGLGWLIGRRYGRAAVLRYGGRIGITPERYARVEAVAHRWGPWMVVGARFVVGLRQMNGLVAGTTGMSYRAFLPANMLGAALWVGLWVALTAWFGRDLRHVLHGNWHHLLHWALFAVPVLIVVVLVLGRRSRRG